MASRKVQKKTGSNRRKTIKTARTAKTARASARSQKAARLLKEEISGLILAALGVLLCLSVFFDNLVGPLGELLGKILGGLFGLSAYAVPPLIIFHALIKIFKPQIFDEDRRFSLLLLLLVLFSAMFQAGLHDISYYENMNVAAYIECFYREGAAAIGKGGAFLPAGGVFGGVIGVPLLFVFRKWGTMIILITLSMVVALMITRLSIAEAARNMAKGTSEAINGMVDAARKKHEEKVIRKNLTSDEEAAAGAPAAAKRKKTKIIDFCVSRNERDQTSGQVMSGQGPEQDAGREDADTGPRIIDLTQAAPTAPPEEKIQPEDKISAGGKSPTGSGAKADDKGNNDRDNTGLQADTESAPYNTPDRSYIYPPIELLSKSKESEKNMGRIKSAAVENAKKLETTLESFGIAAKVINVSVGPAFTRYELHPAPGVKVSRIVNLSDDIALNLASSGIRIEAPIPGKAAIGVEVPNKEVAPISLRSVLESRKFKQHPSSLAVALGKDICGEDTVIDLAKMPHILIAGATGSGKSVCINSIIISLLYKSSPEEVKLLLVDPKVVELGVYNGIPHLLIPVVTDPNKAAGALRWAVSEMTARYRLFAEKGVRDLMGYNASMEEAGECAKLPQVVIIIDELSDLMMVAPHDVEDSICRLAQMARAAGMHLVIATQRPSVNVITGVIKANIPSRISFAVSSQVDSRTILDMAGAEKLLGKGDMLYYPVGIPKPIRVKGAFVTDKEVELVVDFVKNQIRADYDQEIIENINENTKNDDDKSLNSDTDDLLDQAIEAVIDCGQASVSFIQRKFKVGYARAGRIIDQMAERNIISGYEGSKPRHVLISKERWEEMKMSGSGEDV